MQIKYRITCKSCKKKYDVDYGSIKKEVSYEVFSCSKCRNLFSLKNTDPALCPECRNKDLKKYNPHVDENLDFYAKMLKKGLLKKKDFDSLKKYWKSISAEKCPDCGKDTLEWVEIK
ncbi:MAG: hypothetical protein ACLFPQ_00190 [Candidatus Woesearchaeota archaeon]